MSIQKGLVHVEPKNSPDELKPLLLGRRELAVVLGISPASLDRLDVAGRLPRSIKLGGRKLFSRTEIEKWITAGCPDRTNWEASNNSKS